MTDTVTTADVVLDAIRENPDADNPSAFLAANEGNLYHTVAGLPGVIAYRDTGRFLVQFGGPFARAGSAAELLASFRTLARDLGRGLVAVQLQRVEAEWYARDGFTVNQIGASYAVDLGRFALSGTRFMRLRNKIARAHRAGLTVREADFAEWADQIGELDRHWLRGKGENIRELQFLVGQHGGAAQRHRRLFVGLLEERLVAYVSYSPAYGNRPGWLYDLSRRLPGSPPGVVEAINLMAIERFIGEGTPWLHFGFTPFTALDETLEIPGYSRAFRQMALLLFQYGEAVYPARGQLAYKQKWAPHVVLPEYLAFDGPADVAAFVHVFRAAGAL